MGFGDYHGMTAKYEKRYSGGLQFMTAYTYGHALANTGTTLSGSTGFGIIDPRNYSSSYSTPPGTSATMSLPTSTTTSPSARASSTEAT